MMPNERADCRSTGQRGNGRVGLRVDMGPQHVPIVHAVQLVAGQDQHVTDARLLDVTNVLADCVGGALVPVGSFVHRLLGCQ